MNKYLWPRVQRTFVFVFIFVLFLVCFMSEASWLKKKQNQLSPVLERQTGCDIQLGCLEVNLSLCRFLAQATEKRKN